MFKYIGIHGVEIPLDTPRARLLAERLPDKAKCEYFHCGVTGILCFGVFIKVIMGNGSRAWFPLVTIDSQGNVQPDIEALLCYPWEEVKRTLHNG